MEPKSLLPWSRESATELYSEPDGISAQYRALFFKKNRLKRWQHLHTWGRH